MKNLLILGTGAYASALANNLCENFTKVYLYGIENSEINDINNNNQNKRYFGKDIQFQNTNLKAINDIKEIIDDVDYIVIAIPSHVIEDVIEDIVIPNLKNKVIWINASKGFSSKYPDLKEDFLIRFIPKELSNGIYKIIGGTFANEMMNLLPSKLTLTSFDEEKNDDLIKVLTTKKMDIEWNSNFLAINLFSIFKNIYAILQGLISGLGYLKNTQTYLMLESLKELLSICEFLDMNSEVDVDTLLTSALLGDFVLTGTSNSSRNFTFGRKIAIEGNFDYLKEMTVEGYSSFELLKSKYPRIIESKPLLKILDKVIFEKANPRETVNDFFQD